MGLTVPPASGFSEQGRLRPPDLHEEASARMNLADKDDRRNVGEVGDVGLRLGTVRLKRARRAFHVVEAKFGGQPIGLREAASGSIACSSPCR